jgi:hypothetical protein
MICASRDGMERPTASSQAPTSSSTPTTDAIEQRIVALAEQLGRLVGTVQAKADGLLDRPALQEQLTRIRDGATGLLGSLGTGTPGDGSAEAPARRQPARPAPAALPARSAGPARPAPKSAGRTSAAPKTAPTRSAQGRSGGKVDAPGKKHRKAPAQTRSVKHSDEMIPKVRLAGQVRRMRNKR